MVFLRYLEESKIYFNLHYARTLKRRCALIKKGDAQSTRLRYCVMHYNVIRDALKCVSLIS
jgi:hypothetical protein